MFYWQQCSVNSASAQKYIHSKHCLTFLQGILHDRCPSRHLQVAGWPEVGLNLPAGLLTWVQALPHPPEEAHLLLQQRHDLGILLPQQVCPERNRGRQWEKNILWYLKQMYSCFLSFRHGKHVSLTSHLLGFSLQLSLIIFRLTGNPFIFILLPIRPRTKTQ